MKASVIFTTYNHPEWLKKVLWGFAVQSEKDFEIIVADDGSDERTRNVINDFVEETQIPLKHIWHEDNGFQKCRILNRAIVASESEYLIFTDGDCIPHPDLSKTISNCQSRIRFCQVVISSCLWMSRKKSA
jgi:glycosyltransferase involved in cell wall biosynthesis